MQLVSQVNLSAVISVENTKNKTLRGIVWVSVLATPHVSRLPVSFSWTSLPPQLGDVVSCGNWQSREWCRPRFPARREEG